MFKKCEVCGVDFKVKQCRIHRSKTCSKKCLSIRANTQVTKQCLVCGVDFKVIKSSVNKRKTCSVKCANKLANHQVKNKCIICGIDFNHRISHPQKTCSKKCASKLISKKRAKKCDICGVDFYIKPSHYDLRKTCSKKCQGELYKINFSGSNSHTFGKTFSTKLNNPQWAENIRNATKGKINLGDNNGMKQLEARAKVSKFRKELFKDPVERKKLSDSSRKAWADGKFEGVRVGQCKWYAYTKKDGSVIKLQGTWELAFAKWADTEGLQFDTHKGRIKYTDQFGATRSYYPDFYIYDWGCWVDIKNNYHYNLQKEKFQLINESNPEKSIRIILKEELESLGVLLKK